MKSLILSTIAVIAISHTACAANKTKTEPAQIAEAEKDAVPTAKPMGARPMGGFVEDKLKFKVTGMHCGGCANSIKEEVEKVQGVAEAQVDFKSGEVTVISSGPGKLERAPVVSAIEKAGTFKVKK